MMMNTFATNKLCKLRVKSLKPRADPDINPDPAPNPIHCGYTVAPNRFTPLYKWMSYACDDKSLPLARMERGDNTDLFSATLSEKCTFVLNNTRYP